MTEALQLRARPVNAEIRDKTNLLIILAIIAMIGCFYLFTLRPGHEWGDDFSHYILHAKSLAEGKSYSDTAYIPNPSYSNIGPKATYPVLPILLAPVYKEFGLNLTALKIVVLLFFLGLLVVLFLTYRTLLPFHYSLGLILLIGLNPFFWDFKDQIMSDVPFLFFVYATLYAIQRYYDAPTCGRSSFNLAYASLVGILIYLSYGTRAIGGLLIPALLVYDVVRRKSLSRFAISVSVIAGSFIIVQGVALPSPNVGYIGWIYENVRAGFFNRVSFGLWEYATGLSVLWDNGYSGPAFHLGSGRVIKYGVYFVTIVLAAVGFRKRITDAVMVHEVFLIFYVLTLLLIIPAHDLRYLFPIIPLYMFYGLIGAREISSAVSPRSLQYVPIMVAMAVMLSYAAKFTKVDYGPIPEGVARVESQELFRYMREHTQPTDVIVFRKPRALALFTDRRVSIYPKPTDNPSLWYGTTWNYFRDINAHYLVVAVERHARGPDELRDIEWLRQFVERCNDRCKEVFANADFRVYELEYLPAHNSVHRSVLNRPEAKRL